MKTKIIPIFAIIVATIAFVLWRSRGHHEHPPIGPTIHAPIGEEAIQKLETTIESYADIPVTNLVRQVPVASQVEEDVQHFRQMLAMLPVYEETSGPIRVNVQYQTNRNNQITVISVAETDVHLTTHMNGHLSLFMDKLNGHDTRWEEGSAKKWIQSGEWTDAQAEKWARFVTEQLGYDLSTVKNVTIDATPITMKGEDGKLVKVIPHYSVRLRDADNDPRAIIYFRVGEYRVGLVRFSSTLPRKAG